MNDSVYTDGGYADSNPGWHSEDSSWKANHIDGILRRNQVEWKSAVEVGCGAGGILAILGEKYPDRSLYGYEISPQAYEMCQARNASNVNYFNEDFLTSNALNTDLLLLIDVFEHVDDYIGFISSIKERSARAVFHIPLDMSVQTVARSTPIMAARRTIGHLHYFSKETALATLEYAGYKIIDSHITAGAAELGHGGFATKCAGLVRKTCFQISPDYSARFLGGFSLMVLAE